EFTIIASPHCIPIKGFDIKKSSQSDFCQISIDYAKLQLTKFDIIIMNGVWGDSHTNNDFFKKNLQIFLDDTKDNNQKVVFVSAIPKLQSDPKILVGSYFLKHFADIKTINIPIEANKTFSKIISDNSNAKFVDLYNSEAFKNIPFYNGELMYFDPSHLTVHGSLIYAKFSEKKILNALKE
nr:hypothetical protein [Providencia rettgeri]